MKMFDNGELLLALSFGDAPSSAQPAPLSSAQPAPVELPDDYELRNEEQFARQTE
jgi:hypothetical protein